MLEDVLTYICYFSEVITLNIIELKYHKSFINPIFFLTAPFTLILIICLICNSTINFIPFNPVGLWIWIIGLVLFWAAEPVVLYIFKLANLNIKRKYNDQKLNTLNNRQFINIIFLIVVLVALIILSRNAISTNIGSKELGHEVGQGGIIGRISNLVLIALPFFFSQKLKLSFKLPIISLMMLFIFSIGAKTWIMYSVIASVLVGIKNGMKITIRHIILTFLIMFILFSCYYYMNTNIEEWSHFSTFILRHFYFYITCGILPLGEIINLDHNIHVNGLHHPVINLINYNLGNNVEFHSPIWITTDQILGTQSNVFTFFGQLWIDGTTQEYLLYSFLTGFISYIIILNAKFTNNILTYIAAGYTYAALFFGWYGCGFFFLRIWEIYAYCYIFYILFKRRLYLYFV